MITVAEFKAKFSEFAAIDDARLQPWLDEASRNVCSPAWASRAVDGCAFLAAHLFTVFGQSETLGGSAFGFGPATQKRVDQISVSYAIGDAFENSDLGSTAYGRRFISLRRLIFANRCI